jgi:hypothetical protein
LGTVEKDLRPFVVPTFVLSVDLWARSDYGWPH